MKTPLKIVAAAVLLLSASFSLKAQTLKDAIQYTENEQFVKAKSAFIKLIAAEPTNGDNFFYFGDLLLKMDDIDSANVVFQKGCDIEPTNPLVHVGKGRGLL